MEPPPPLSYPLFHNLFREKMHYPIFLFFLFSSLSFLSLTLLSFSLYKRFYKTPKHHNPDETLSSDQSPPRVSDEGHRPNPDNPTHLRLLEVLPSDSAKWASLFVDPDSVPEQRENNKKRKKAKKKKGTNSRGEERTNTGLDRIESVCLYPFTSSGSALQRKIKQQYDELVKSNHSNNLKLPQVVQFANSLIDARNELQHKADAVQRKFVITKALLCKADRSSFDRLHQQIYKLELEQKRLEEDAFVYNSLQYQLKLSPAYQKMLEVGACMEKTKQCRLEDHRDDEFTDISFEELLAQEKKDSFWQKNGKSRVCSS